MADISLTLQLLNTQFIAALAESKKATAEAAEQMKASFENVAGAMEKVNAAMIAVTAILAGGKVFGEAISASINAAKGAQQMGREMGITATQASILKVAMDENFVSSESMSAASNKIATTLKKNENAFRELGVTTRDANGNFKNSFDIMTDVNEKLSEFKEGTDRNVEGQKIYGRSWAEIAPTIRITGEAMKEAKQKAESLGLVVGQEGIAQATEYRKAMAGVHTVFEALQKVIGDALVPVLTKLGEWFNDVGPAAVAIMRTAIYTIYAAWSLFKEAVTVDVDLIAGSLSILAATANLVGRVIDRAMHLDWAGVKAAWTTGTADIVAKSKFMASQIAADMKDAADARTKFLEGQDAKQTPTAEKTGQASTGGDGKEKSRTGEWETELNEKKAAYQEDAAAHGQLLEFSKQQEIAYWQHILDTTRTSVEERKTIRSKMAADELTIDKAKLEGSLAALKADESAHGKSLTDRLAAEITYAEAVKGIYKEGSKEYVAAQSAISATHRAIVDQDRKLDDVRVQSARDSMVRQIDMDQQYAKERFDIGATSLEQYIAQERSFEDRKYAIKVKALQDEIALINPKEDPVAVAKLYAQLETLKSQHEAAMIKIEVQGNAQSTSMMKSFTTTFTNGMEASFKGIVNGTLTVGKAFKNMMTTMLDAVVSSLVKIAAQWITSHALQMLLGKQEQASNSATAATGAASSAASIPIYGWIIAAAAAAAVFAAASSYSAASGFDIPSNLNPMTQLHSKEMVLPAPMAEKVRNMTDEGAKGGGSGAMNLHIQALDGHSVQRVLTRNATHVQQALKKINNRFMR